MELRITISVDNAAFSDDPGEAARILRDLADRLESGMYAPGDETPLRDVNGNRVGECTIS